MWSHGWLWGRSDCGCQRELCGKRVTKSGKLIREKIGQQAGQQYGNWVCWVEGIGERERGAEAEAGGLANSLLSLEAKVHFVFKLLNNNALEGRPEILYILIYESYRDTRMRHLSHPASRCSTVTGLWQKVALWNLWCVELFWLDRIRGFLTKPLFFEK